MNSNRKKIIDKRHKAKEQFMESQILTGSSAQLLSPPDSALPPGTERWPLATPAQNRLELHVLSVK